MPLTPNTITDPPELLREIERIRQRGYSIDNEEVVLGVHCVGMPILDRSGRAVGGISITGPARRCRARSSMTSSPCSATPAAMSAGGSATAATGPRSNSRSRGRAAAGGTGGGGEGAARPTDRVGIGGI